MKQVKEIWFDKGTDEDSGVYMLIDKPFAMKAKLLDKRVRILLIAEKYSYYMKSIKEDYDKGFLLTPEAYLVKRVKFWENRIRRLIELDIYLNSKLS